MPTELKPGETEKLWTISNIITLVRICLVPVFVIALITPWPDWFSIESVSSTTKSLIAALIFILISCTDWLDGYLARTRGEVTNFGKFMDPLADKILVCAALLALVELKVLPSWPVLIILAREFIVSGIRVVAADKGVVIAASWYGKAKTVAQIIAIVLFIVKDSILPATSGNPLDNPLYVLSWLAMIVALALTIISMMDYFAKARHLLGFTTSKEKAAMQHECEKAKSGADESNEDIARRIIEIASKNGKTVGCAESLTGGLIAGTLTAIPGSSQVVRGGIVSYVNEIKHRELGVDETLLETEGAVCEGVARQMAEGVRKNLGTDIAVAVTGIAGPGGEEPGKPVGTVWAALSTQNACKTTCFHFDGNRKEVRNATVREALRMIEDALSTHSA